MTDHIVSNQIKCLNCCATKREAIAAMEVYKTYEGML